MGLAYVICANDSILGVVIGSIEAAEKKMRDLADRDYHRQRQCFGQIFTREKYNESKFWHWHTAEVLV
jgi:hypothetical protein